MAQKQKDILQESRVPWITRDGFIDLAAFPLDGTLKQAVGEDEEKFRSSCRTLVSMYAANRTEAAIVLYGLLMHNKNRIDRKEVIVEALGHIETKECAELLFKELRRTISSNSTRKYVNAILKSLQMFPLEDINEGFETLLSESKWSYRMKNKFNAILNGEDFQYYG